MYVYPFDPINFDVLGDDNIGIGIETSFDSEVSMSVDDICSINLIRWPIKRVTTMDGKSLLQYEELYRTNEIQDMHIEPTILVEPLSKKRKYFFTNRKPKMSINPSKKSKQISVSICSTSFIHRLLCQKVLSICRTGYGPCFAQRILGTNLAKENKLCV